MARRHAGAALATLGLALAAPAGAAAGSEGFVEHVRVLHEWHGEAGAYLGWAVSELADIDRDGATDVILGEPATAAGGSVWVYSGRSGRLLHRFDGAAGDFFGGAIADAGDTNRDGVHDIVVGAPNNPTTVFGRGRAYLYSGRSGRLLHVWEAAGPDDTLGSAVAGAGDQDGDGYDDVLVGALGDDLAGVDAGAAFVFSGRTHRVLRRIDGGDPGGGFGSAVDATASLRGDRRPDLIVGALDEGPGQAPGGGGAHVLGRRGELLLARPARRRRPVRQLLRGRRGPRRRRSRRRPLRRGLRRDRRQRLRRGLLGPRRRAHPRLGGRRR